MSDEPTERDVEALLAEHEPVLGRFGGMSGIVGCSCMSARDYRAAGHRAGQGGWRAHLADLLAERIAEARREGAAEQLTKEDRQSLSAVYGYEAGQADGRTEGAAKAWEEGAEATAEWMAANPGPSGVPTDPPSNPYDRAAAL